MLDASHLLGKNIILNQYIYIDEIMFHELKQKLKNDPNYEIVPLKKYTELWNHFYLELFGSFILGFIFFIFDLFSSHRRMDFASFLGDIFLGTLVWLVLGAAISIYNYYNYINTHNRYYKSLKKAIINIHDYKRFSINR